MLKFILSFFLLVILSYSSAQDFYYDKYDVDVLVKTDGALQVTETMDVYFNEERRGIIRSIPTSYKVSRLPDGEEQAFRPLKGSTYHLILRDISVPGNPFTVYTEGAYKKIRIGDPRIYLKGNKRYTITYVVYGALNEFEDRVELLWNLLGTEHPTRTESFSFNIRFEKPVTLQDEDVLILGGRSGKRRMNTTYQIKPDAISGQSKSRLKRGEGITAGVALPVDYFDRIYIHPKDLCRNYYVDAHEIDAQLLTNGRIRVQEYFEIVCKYSLSHFDRTFTRSVTDAEDGNQFLFIENEFIDSEYGALTYEIRRGGKNPGIRIMPERGSFQGRVRLNLQYDIAGAMYSIGEQRHAFYLDAVKYESEEPLDHSVIRIGLPDRAFFEPGATEFKSASTTLANVDADLSAESIRATFNWDARHINEVSLNGILNSGGIDYSDLPGQVFYRDYLVKQYTVNISLEDNTAVRIGESYDLQFKYRDAGSSFRLHVPRDYSKRHFRDKSGEVHFPGMNLLKSRMENAVSLESASSGLATNVSGDGIDIRLDRGNRSREISEGFEYKVKGNFQSLGDSDFYAVRLSEPAVEPVASMQIKWSDEDFKMIDDAYLKRNGKYIELPVSQGDDGFTTELAGLLPAGGGDVVLQFRGAAYEPVGLSTGQKLSAFVVANRYLLISLLWVCLLWLLWYFIGRDKKWKKSVAYTPPVGMTPAEAGYIWDGKIHKKDLVSLIYYWASYDLLEIEEVKSLGSTDYIIYKMKDLPEDAQSFERILFNGLFESGDEVHVSDMRNSLYTTMREAHRDLKQFGRKYRFWVPGTRAFGNALFALGCMLIGVGLLVFGIHVGRGDLSIAVPLLTAGIGAVILGWIMPRKSKMGTEVYHELLSFREFIRTSTIEELEELYDKDSDYFIRTISFAIVMGLGTTWARKFKGLMTKPPRYYRGYDPHTPWDTVIFTHWIMSGMHSMNRDFNYQMPASSLSDGTSTWGGSGGSFGGGGFSSGGGFGGGGSASW